MIEWLQKILGESYTEDVDAKIAARLETDYAPKADLDAANQARADTEAALAEVKRSLEEFKDTDVEALRADVEKYKGEAAQARADAEAQVAAVKFDALVDSAIQTVHGRSGKAIKALLDMDTLRSSEDQAAAVAEALDKLRGEEGYLFEPTTANPAVPPSAAGTGSGSVMQQPKYVDGVEAEFYNMNPGLKQEE